MQTCNHPRLTAYIHQHNPAEEPPFADVALICDECGARLDYEDRPEGAVIRDEYGQHLDQFERQPCHAE